MREGQTFVRIHSGKNLLGIAEFGRIVAGMTEESIGFLNIEDVYKDSRFNSVDFPSVVRSLVCLPIVAGGRLAGFLLMSHSRPRFFNDNHIRVLRIIASSVAHLKHLTSVADRSGQVPAPAVAAEDRGPAEPGAYSVILLSFEKPGHLKRFAQPDRETLRGIREYLQKHLEPRESLLSYEDGQLIALLPGVAADTLPRKVRSLRDGFRRWKAEQGEPARDIRLSLGFSAGEDGDDLARTLETASQFMRSDSDEDVDLAVEM
jgi:hypothetical protein